jgi:hypothetical protein
LSIVEFLLLVITFHALGFAEGVYAGWVIWKQRKGRF